jgi:hypothetical protein
MLTLTPQQIAFRTWCDEKGGTGEVARILGISAPHASLIYHGHRYPGLKLASKIEREAGETKAGKPLAPGGTCTWIMRLPASGWHTEA